MDTSSKLRNFSKCQLKFYRCSLVVAVNKLLDGKGGGGYLSRDNPPFALSLFFLSYFRLIFFCLCLFLSPSVYSLSVCVSFSVPPSIFLSYSLVISAKSLSLPHTNTPSLILCESVYLSHICVGVCILLTLFPTGER